MILKRNDYCYYFGLLCVGGDGLDEEKGAPFVSCLFIALAAVRLCACHIAFSNALMCACAHRSTPLFMWKAKVESHCTTVRRAQHKRNQVTAHWWAVVKQLRGTNYNRGRWLKSNTSKRVRVYVWCVHKISNWQQINQEQCSGGNISVVIRKFSLNHSHRLILMWFLRFKSSCRKF